MSFALEGDECEKRAGHWTVQVSGREGSSYSSSQGMWATRSSCKCGRARLSSEMSGGLSIQMSSKV